MFAVESVSSLQSFSVSFSSKNTAFEQLQRSVNVFNKIMTDDVPCVSCKQ